MQVDIYHIEEMGTDLAPLDLYFAIYYSAVTYG